MEELTHISNGDSEGGGFTDRSKLLQNNGQERVDFILVWKTDKQPTCLDESEDVQNLISRRAIFEKNLQTFVNCVKIV